MDQKKEPVAGVQTTAPPAFHVMLKPRGAICNLDCAYCYYLSKERLYPGSRFCMSDGLLEEYTRQYIKAQRVPEMTFAWQGGEPTLMGLDFFRLAVECQQKYRRPGVHIHNALQTNGTTLDDEWCHFFRKHNFLVGISLDGPRELHDAYRVDKGGKPTFDRVMGGVEWDNDTGFQEGEKATKRSVAGRQYGDFLIAIFDEWVRRDVGRVFVQIFDVALAAWLGQRPGLCTFEETCGTALVMEHNGDLYSCDHFVEPRHRLGNIQEIPLIEMVGSKQQRQFGLAKRDTLPRYCRECQARFICNGGCPKNRILRTPDGEPGLNYLCEGYKAFFTHIDWPMQIRPPANIMHYLAEEEAELQRRFARSSCKPPEPS